MKKLHLLVAVCACAIATFVTPATALTIDYSNLPGGVISFDPLDGCTGAAGTVGCFDFITSSVMGNQFSITSGTALGLEGFFGGGSFGVGPISINGSLQTATVNGIGSLFIFDGPNTLTATLIWNDIFTFGTVGGINAGGSVNLSSISYGGTNPDLVALASAGSGTQTASFQFAIPTSLTVLFGGSASTATSYSGSIAPVPIPAAVWLFGSGLLGLLGLARRKKAA